MVIDGVPLYGDRSLMRRFYARAELEDVAVGHPGKQLATVAAGTVIADLEAQLDAALQAEGSALAPLVEADP